MRIELYYVNGSSELYKAGQQVDYSKLDYLIIG